MERITRVDIYIPQCSLTESYTVVCFFPALSTQLACLTGLAFGSFWSTFIKFLSRFITNVPGPRCNASDDHLWLSQSILIQVSRVAGFTRVDSTFTVKHHSPEFAGNALQTKQFASDPSLTSALKPRGH